MVAIPSVRVSVFRPSFVGRRPQSPRFGSRCFVPYAYLQALCLALCCSRNPLGSGLGVSSFRPYR